VSGEQDRAQRHETVRQQALASNRGGRDWRQWKEAGLADFFKLAEQTERLEVLQASLEGDFHVVYGVRMPVPCWPLDGRLVIADGAIFDLHYLEEWRWRSPPGWAPLGLWRPQDPFHPNCRPNLRGAICLGTLPAGVRVRELILLGYYTLTLQNRVLDETDPHGVLNPMACEFYRNHPEYLPLTRAGLLDPWEGLNHDRDQAGPRSAQR
jgi:hypothetical protein